MRGDVYDGRNFIKTAMGGPADPKIKARIPISISTSRSAWSPGNNGETVRGLDWRMSRRSGKVRTFSLNAKIGRDTPLIGEMRTRINNGKPVLYFETNDAGALFRFTDIYQRMVGGQMWVGMDPPTQDGSPQEGIINVSAFSIRGESTLDRVVSNAPNAVPSSNNIDFSQARADFTRAPGRMTLRDGVLRGPMLGATVEGNIDYARDQVHDARHARAALRAQQHVRPDPDRRPVPRRRQQRRHVRHHLRGRRHHRQSAPVVNPISAIAPGVLRKFFEFRETPDRPRLRRAARR